MDTGEWPPDPADRDRPADTTDPGRRGDDAADLWGEPTSVSWTDQDQPWAPPQASRQWPPPPPPFHVYPPTGALPIYTPSPGHRPPEHRSPGNRPPEPPEPEPPPILRAVPDLTRGPSRPATPRHTGIEHRTEQPTEPAPGRHSVDYRLNQCDPGSGEFSYRSYRPGEPVTGSIEPAQRSGSLVPTRAPDPNRPDAAGRPFRRLDEHEPVEPYEEEPRYSRVLGYTSLWYAIPGLLYFVWTLTLAGYRRSVVMHSFTSSLPWLIGAVVLSELVAAILRWAVIGWRTLTISFAGAVIGAGVATIAHSLAR
jgi:hypothetical protein